MDLSTIAMWASIIGLASGVVFWLWPRSKEKRQHSLNQASPTATVGSHSSVGTINQVSGNQYQAGRDIHVHPAPTAAAGGSTATAVAIPKVGTAGITIEAFNEQLRNAHAFRQKALLTFYQGKTFIVRGRITDVDTVLSFPTVHLTQSDIFISIRCSALPPSEFDYIHDDRWLIEAEVPLTNDSVVSTSAGSMFFGSPVVYQVIPI